MEPAPAAEPDADAILARLSQLVRDTKTETPAPVAQETPARTPAQEQQPEPELYTAEDKTFLDTYEKDWSDVSRGEALKRRAEYQQLVSHIYGELAKVIQPLRETVGVIAERTHLSDIKAAVPDYSDDMRSQVLDWVDRQPAYLKSAYEQVVTGGSPEEVQDLINRWSAETKAAPAAAPAPAQVQATRQAAAALAPVSTKRSAPPATDDMGNFDSAFAKFASEKLQ